MENTTREPTLQEIVVAALLHDVGKFYQRASKSDDLEQNYKENYCVDKKNYFSHLHSGYTAKFFEDNKSIFHCFESYDKIKDISAMHHKPNTIFQTIVSIADAISAGIDRVESDEKEDNKKYREIPLTSPFSLINFDDDNSLNKQKNDDNLKSKSFKVYQLNHLSYQTVYPKLNDVNNILGYESYNNLYKQFIEEIGKINSDFYLFFESSLLRIMEKYMWCIPSATNDEYKDVSLYDHSYTTASIAMTLYLYLKEKYQGNWVNCEKDFNKPVYEIINDKNLEFARLLKVDVSGIQNYIYDINKAKFSAKLLRAKSFEISFMLKGIAQKIKDFLGLDQVSILFEGGGNLLMIIPSNDCYINKLNQMQKEIEENVFEKYFGELSFIFSLSDSFKLDDFLLDNFNQVVRKNLEQKAEISKLKKNQEVLKTKGPIFNQPYENLNEKAKEGFKICSACDKRISNPGNHDDFCDNCSKLVNMGRDLTRSESYIITKNVFKANEYSYDLLSDLFLNLEKSFNANNILKNKNNENILQVFGIKESSLGLRYSNPYHVPEDDNKEPLTFEDLGNNSVGNDKIAMLKGDVNNLGAIFWFGVQRKIKENNDVRIENILTLSRYASLSRMFDFFFTEILVKLIDTGDRFYSIPVIIKNKEKNDEKDKEKEKNSKSNEKFYYKDRIYVIYSGGDDFVLIGSWDAIFEFAKDLNEEFKKFVGENDNINFSCSIEIFNKKTQPLFMAETCEESLKDVKKKNKEIKNEDYDKKVNVSVFGELLSWEDYKNAIKNGKQLIEYMNTVEGCSRSFVYKLLKIARMKKDFSNNKNVLRNSRYKALFKYSFARNIAEHIKNNEEKRDELEKFFINKLIENSEDNNQRYTEKNDEKNWGGIVAIQYALQATRKVSK